jgi:hypothetical protein
MQRAGLLEYDVLRLQKLARRYEARVRLGV